MSYEAMPHWRGIVSAQFSPSLVKETDTIKKNLQTLAKETYRH